jgi:hypothetical protein
VSSTRRTTRVIGLAAACLGLALTPPKATAQNVRQQSSQVTRGDVAEQLGAKVNSNPSEEMGIGSSITATLMDPAKLSKLGITGMHEGARVSVMRVAPDRLRVEVDEMEPVAVTKKATLKIDDKGRLATTTP